MKNNLLKTLLSATLLLGTVNNVSYTMEYNNINEQINNNNNSFGNNNLQDFYIKESRKCLKELETIRNKVVDYEFDKIEECIKKNKIGNELNIQNTETLENDINEYKLIFNYNLDNLYRNARTNNGVLEYISNKIKVKDIPLYSDILKKLFETFRRYKKHQDSKTNLFFSEYVIQFEQTVNEINDYIKEYETIDSTLQSILQEDITSQKNKASYTRYREALIDGIIAKSEKCDISVEMIDMCCRDTQQTKTTMEELYSYFKDANNKYNIYVNLYNDLKIEIKRYDNFIKQYGEKMKELARALDDLVSRVRANRNILVERLYPIIKPIFNMFIPLK